LHPLHDPSQNPRPTSLPRKLDGSAPPPRQFTSDNRSGICPEAWAALATANDGNHLPSYGEDPWTHQAAELLRQHFDTDCDVYFVFNGTAANSLALASCCQSYHSVICHELAHIETDECGAPEFFSNGTKLLLASGKNGKLSPAAVESLVRKRNDIHYPKPRVLSLTQATELGTLYTPAEVAALCTTARSLNLRVHMDGARFANAVASLGCHPADLTWRAGVDVLCFGGTKNGMSGGEAVIFFDRSLSEEFAYRCKQAGQLASKMRFLSAQWVGMLQNDALFTHAGHANAMAQLLQQKLGCIPGIRVLYPVQANAVFVELPPHILSRLAERGWQLYTFIGGGTRLMCSWNTTETDIDRLLQDVGSDRP
jgi:threonine aldolase